MKQEFKYDVIVWPLIAGEFPTKDKDVFVELERLKGGSRGGVGVNYDRGGVSYM